jgi:hypothetical protein
MELALPTSVRPLEVKDDNFQETGVLSRDAQPQPQHAILEDESSAKPPIPFSLQQQAENTLKEIFPSIDAAIIRGIL